MENENKDVLKNEDIDSAGNEQPTENNEGKEPTLEELQAQLDKERQARESLEAEKIKLAEERDNYRQATISAKAKQYSLSDDDEQAEQPAQPIKPAVELDEDAGWQEVERRAEAKANAIYESRTRKEIKSNENLGIKKFMQSHPETIGNDSLMMSIKNEYTDKNGKTVEGIVYDLERAYKMYKIENNLVQEAQTNTNTAERQVAKFPTGNSNTQQSSGSYNDFEKDVINKYCEGNVEKFAAFKKAVMEGVIEVPDSTLDKLSNNQ